MSSYKLYYRVFKKLVSLPEEHNSGSIMILSSYILMISLFKLNN